MKFPTGCLEFLDRVLHGQLVVELVMGSGRWGWIVPDGLWGDRQAAVAAGARCVRRAAGLRTSMTRRCSPRSSMCWSVAVPGGRCRRALGRRSRPCTAGFSSGPGPVCGDDCTRRCSSSWTARTSSTCRALSSTPLTSALKRGELAGPSPVDRGKPGSKMHVLSDANGLPLRVGVSAANTHDSQALKPMLSHFHMGHESHATDSKPQRLHADKAYDVPSPAAMALGASASASASPARESSPASDSVDAGGSSNAPCPDCPATADSTTATSGNQATTWPFSDWPRPSAATNGSAK